jgi:hypothetical protein
MRISHCEYRLSQPSSWALAALVLVMLSASGPGFASDAAILRCRTLTVPADKLACYEAIVVPPSERYAVPGAMPAAPLVADAASFGLEHKVLPLQAAAMQTSILGAFTGWGPRDVLQFANGQRWQISDDSVGVLNAINPKVTVRRGVLGAFYLEIEGTNRSPKVRRLP